MANEKISDSELNRISENDREWRKHILKRVESVHDDVSWLKVDLGKTKTKVKLLMGISFVILSASIGVTFTGENGKENIKDAAQEVTKGLIDELGK